MHARMRVFCREAEAAATGAGGPIPEAMCASRPCRGGRGDTGVRGAMASGPRGPMKVLAMSAVLAVSAGMAQAVPVQWSFSDWSLGNILADVPVMACGSFVYNTGTQEISAIALALDGTTVSVGDAVIFGSGNGFGFSFSEGTPDEPEGEAPTGTAPATSGVGFFGVWLDGPLATSRFDIGLAGAMLMQSARPRFAFGTEGRLTRTEDATVPPLAGPGPSVVALPASLPLLLAALGGLMLLRRRAS